MKTTQQEIIELAREHATRYTNRHYPDKPVFTFTQDALQKVIELALERFGAGDGEPVAWMSPGKERLEFSRSDTVYGSHTIPLYTHPSPTDLRAEYLRGLEDAAKVVEQGYYANTRADHAQAIRALKGKQ